MFDTSGGLDDLERAIDKVIASEHELDLPRLRRLIDRLEAGSLRAVRAAARAGALTELTLSPAGVLSESCRMSRGAARRTLATARTRCW